MKTLPLSKLKEQYEFVCNEYAVKFANKQGLVFEGWSGGVKRSFGLFGDYYFDLDDIIYDINTKQPKGLILKWQNDSVEAHLGKLSTQNINYYSYSNGLRYSDLTE